MGNACYYSLKKILSSLLHSKKLKVNTLPVVLYGCEIWSHTLRKEHMLRLFENKVLRKVFGGLRKIKLQENGESYTLLSNEHCIFVQHN